MSKRLSVLGLALVLAGGLLFPGCSRSGGGSKGQGITVSESRKRGPAKPGELKAKYAPQTGGVQAPGGGPSPSGGPQGQGKAVQPAPRQGGGG